MGSVNPAQRMLDKIDNSLRNGDAKKVMMAASAAKAKTDPKALKTADGWPCAMKLSQAPNIVAACEIWAQPAVQWLQAVSQRPGSLRKCSTRYFRSHLDRVCPHALSTTYTNSCPQMLIEVPDVNPAEQSLQRIRAATSPPVSTGVLRAVVKDVKDNATRPRSAATGWGCSTLLSNSAGPFPRIPSESAISNAIGNDLAMERTLHDITCWLENVSQNVFGDYSRSRCHWDTHAAHWARRSAQHASDLMGAVFSYVMSDRTEQETYGMDGAPGREFLSWCEGSSYEQVPVEIFPNGQGCDCTHRCFSVKIEGTSYFSGSAWLQTPNSVRAPERNLVPVMVSILDDLNTLRWPAELIAKMDLDTLRQQYVNCRLWSSAADSIHTGMSDMGW